MGARGHPSYAVLNRFADRTLKPYRHRRVARHLAHCSRCRREVTFIRRAGRVARSMEAPPAPPETLENVLERRSSGERVLLPLASPGAPPTPRRALPAIAAMVTLFLVGLMVSTELLQADRATLQIEPQRPQVGDVLRIRYDGGQEFAGARYLKLRARFRTGSGQHWEQIVAMLHHGDDGSFQGTLTLPDSVVYAAFAVEDLQGEQVDSHNQALWDIMVHDRRGRPLLTALAQRVTDLHDRDEPEAYRTAQLMVDLYPNSPMGWSRIWEHEQRLPNADSLRQLHLARLREMERAATDAPPPDAETLTNLAWYAAILGQYSSADLWVREAESRGARSVPLYQTRALLLRIPEGPRPREALRQLETMWAEAPAPIAAVANAGWYFARQARDWQAALRWLPRYSLMGRNAASILEDLQETFGDERSLQWAMTHLDDTLLRAAATRPLDVPRQQQVRELNQARQVALAAMARMALRAGRPAVAGGLAAEALPLGWETSALQTIGQVLLETGDTTNAREAYARAAADPVGARPPEPITRSAGWTEELEEARYDLMQYVLSESVIRYAPDGSGPVSGPGVTVFVVACGQGVARANALAEELDSVPVTIYTLLEPRPGSDGHACASPLPVRYDSTGEVADAYRVRGFPFFFVTDAEGRIRFQNSRPAEIPRQLMALRRLSSPRLAD